jgi:hypothetical protein
LGDNYDLKWELPNVHAVTTTLQDTITAQPKSTSAPKSTGAGGIFGYLVNKIFQDDLDDPSEWEQDGDDMISSQETQKVDIDLPIIQTQLMNLSLTTLQQKLQTQDSSSSCIIVAKSQWKTWTAQPQPQPQHLLNKLSRDDLDFLLDALILRKHAKIVQRPNHDLILLYSQPQSDNHDISKQEQVEMALWDLQRAQDSLQQQVDDWIQTQKDCQQQALQYKRQDQTSLALFQLSKSKLISKQIDSATAALLKLQQAQSSIQESQTNQSLMELLQSSTQLLQTLTKQTSLQEIDQVKLDWQDQQQNSNEVHRALTTTSNTTTTTEEEEGEEEELLMELQKLTFQDDPVTSTTDPIGTKKRSTKTKSKKKRTTLGTPIVNQMKRTQENYKNEEKVPVLA